MICTSPMLFTLALVSVQALISNTVVTLYVGCLIKCGSDMLAWASCSDVIVDQEHWLHWSLPQCQHIHVHHTVNSII